MILREQSGGQQVGSTQRTKNLHRMFLYFCADAVNLPFRHNVAVAHQHNLVGNLVDLMKDVAGDDHVHSLLSQRFKERNGFGTAPWDQVR